jgi:hypothetical protein
MSSDALKTLDAILQGSAAGPQQYAPSSRYYGLATTTLTLPDGTEVSYLTRRFVPAPERFAQLTLHTVAQGDRLDNLAAKHFNDPLAWWRLADANRALRPDDLIEIIGRRLRIALPEGVPLGTGKI